MTLSYLIHPSFLRASATDHCLKDKYTLKDSKVPANISKGEKHDGNSNLNAERSNTDTEKKPHAQATDRDNKRAKQQSVPMALKQASSTSNITETHRGKNVLNVKRISSSNDVSRTVSAVSQKTRGRVSVPVVGQRAGHRDMAKPVVAGERRLSDNNSRKGEEGGERREEREGERVGERGEGGEKGRGGAGEMGKREKTKEPKVSLPSGEIRLPGLRGKAPPPLHQESEPKAIPSLRPITRNSGKQNGDTSK